MKVLERLVQRDVRRLIWQGQRTHAMAEYRENHFSFLVDISLRTGQRI